jgi:hypothetical protein
MKLKYIIESYCFQPYSGGVVAMHKLCHDLRILGEDSYVLSKETHPDLDAPFLGSNRFSKKETVIIYPEIRYGNPHNCKNVVRWLLNTPGYCSGTSADSFYNQKKDTDLLFKYSEYYKLRNENESKGLLTTTFIDKNIFYPSDTGRKGTAFLIKKGGMQQKIHPPDSFDLTNYETDLHFMAEILRQVEFFYCYDNACFWVTLAALCGATPIVVPNTDMTAKDWYEKFPSMSHGVAYGTDMIQYANDTKHLVNQNLELLQKKELDTVRNFVKICESNFL